MNPPSQGTPENPSPGPQNHPQQMNQTPEQIEMIKLIQVNFYEFIMAQDLTSYKHSQNIRRLKNE
jgi:hypothetical protein